MDRRSWLWRRKSSLEKSPGGETESSGSLSSHSERFSDDQTINHNIQSPEVTSKAASDDESVKSLSDKLSEALVNIRNKEDLVKQHSKVAEEAVSGWERAEKEVSVLKIQNESLTHKNLILEESVDHLDEALKECLRQHRQAREEEEDKIQDAIANSSREWESNISQLENQLSDLRTQLQNANAKLEAAEKDKSLLKLQLQIRSRETDFATRAAEAASKHHLDSRKKVAMLEAECLQIKARARRATDTASSLYVESFTDSHSDIGERVQLIEDDSCKASLIVPSVDIYLMDDFLEMERLASLPEGTSETSPPRGEETTRLRDELEAMIHRTAELEDTLEKITAEKARLEIGLSESRIQLKASDDQLKFTEAKLVDMKIQLALANEDTKKEVERTKAERDNLNTLLDEAEKNLEEVQHQLKETIQAKCIVEMQLEDANVKKEESEARLKLMELELERSVSTLEREVEKEKNASREAVAKCDKLETEISRIKSDAQFQRSAELRINQDKEVAIAATKFAECQKTIASLGRQLKSLATLDDFLLETERQVTVV